MKKIFIMLVGGLLFGLSSCQKSFVNLNPPASFTDAVYFKQPCDFKAYTGGFYGQLMGWNSPYGGNSVYNYMDVASDESTYFNFSADVGRGTITVPGGDNRW